MSWDCKCKFSNRTCNSNQKWNNETFQCEGKIIVHAKKIIIEILADVFARIVNI